MTVKQASSLCTQKSRESLQGMLNTEANVKDCQISEQMITLSRKYIPRKLATFFGHAQGYSYQSTNKFNAEKGRAQGFPYPSTNKLKAKKGPN